MEFIKILLATILFSESAYAMYNGGLNEAGLSLIKKFEGFHPNVYHKPGGIKVIGYGHACHINTCMVPINRRYTVPLSLASADALLKEDLIASEDCVRNAVSYADLTPNQFAALTSFAFNLGCGKLKTSTLLQKLNQADVTGAGKEFAKWASNAGGTRLKGMLRRRYAERNLFCSGSICEGETSREDDDYEQCIGNVTASSLNVRTSPWYHSKDNIVGGYPRGEIITILGRIEGQDVYGNKNWFKTSIGYCSAYYVSIVSSNGKDWCMK